MSLADHLPEHFKKGFASRNLDIGAVLKLRVKDTNPPKEKRFIVVGHSSDKLLLATIFINSEINLRVNWAIELRELNLPFEAQGREYLDKDSFIDCSQLIPRNYAEIADAIEKRPEIIIGHLSKSDLQLIRKTIISAPTIKGKHKKKFGFFDT